MESGTLGETKKYGLLLPPDVMQAVAELAKKHRRSLNAEVAWALEQYAEREDADLLRRTREENER